MITIGLPEGEMLCIVAEDSHGVERIIYVANEAKPGCDLPDVEFDGDESGIRVLVEEHGRPRLVHQWEYEPQPAVYYLTSAPRDGRQIYLVGKGDEMVVARWRSNLGQQGWIDSEGRYLSPDDFWKGWTYYTGESAGE